MRRVSREMPRGGLLAAGEPTVSTALSSNLYSRRFAICAPNDLQGDLLRGLQSVGVCARD